MGWQIVPYLIEQSQLNSCVSFQEVEMHMQMIKYLIRGISMGEKERKTKVSHWSRLILVSEFWKQAVEISRCLSQILFRWSEGRQWHVVDSPGLQCEMSLVIFLQQARRLSTYELLWWFLWSLYQVALLWLAWPWEMGSFGSQWFKVRRVGGKLETYLESDSQTLEKTEEFRIQSSLQVGTKMSKEQH